MSNCTQGINHCPECYSIHSTTQIKQIEQIQRNAARWVRNQPYNPHNPTSVTNLLQELQWTSLQQRRSWADLTLMYKVVNFHVAIPTIYHPIPAPLRSTRGSHCMKFMLYRPHLDIYTFLVGRILDDWVSPNFLFYHVFYAYNKPKAVCWVFWEALRMPRIGLPESPTNNFQIQH